MKLKVKYCTVVAATLVLSIQALFETERAKSKGNDVVISWSGASRIQASEAANNACAYALNKPVSNNSHPVLQRIEMELEKNEVSDQSFHDLERIIEKEPANYRAHLILGRCYDKLGLVELAHDEYQLAAKHGPNDPKAFVELLKSHLQSGDMQSAMSLLSAASRRFPNDPEIMFWMGNYLYARNRVREAEFAYRMALGHKKKIPGLYSQLAEIRLRMRQFSEAEHLADSELALDKNARDAYRIKGFSLLGRGRYSEAAKPLELAFRYEPNKEGIAQTYAWCLYWTGQYEKALEPALIDLALSADPSSNNIEQKKLLIRILKSVPPDQAQKEIERLVEYLDKRSKNAAFHFALGDVLDTIGRPQDAIKQYKLGLKIDPKHGRGLYRLGKDLELYTHDYMQALTCYKKAYALRPDDTEIEARLRRLEDRLAIRQNDWAWQMKDWFRKAQSLL